MQRLLIQLFGYFAMTVPLAYTGAAAPSSVVGDGIIGLITLTGVVLMFIFSKDFGPHPTGQPGRAGLFGMCLIGFLVMFAVGWLATIRANTGSQILMNAGFMTVLSLFVYAARNLAALVTAPPNSDNKDQKL